MEIQIVPNSNCQLGLSQHQPYKMDLAHKKPFFKIRSLPPANVLQSDDSEKAKFLVFDRYRF